jgi:hypothetical protein
MYPLFRCTVLGISHPVEANHTVTGSHIYLVVGFAGWGVFHPVPKFHDALVMEGLPISPRYVLSSKDVPRSA